MRRTFHPSRQPRQDDAKRKIEDMSPKKEGQPSTCNQPVGGNFRRIISDVQFWVAYLMLCCNPFSSHKTSIKEKKKVTAETRSNVQEAYCSMDKDKWIPQKSTGGIFFPQQYGFWISFGFWNKGWCRKMRELGQMHSHHLGYIWRICSYTMKKHFFHMMANIPHHHLVVSDIMLPLSHAFSSCLGPI